jgi:hypothetical protein
MKLLVRKAENYLSLTGNWTPEIDFAKDFASFAEIESAASLLKLQKVDVLIINGAVVNTVPWDFSEEMIGGNDDCLRSTIGVPEFSG